jgi:hypothetical protein
MYYPTHSNTSSKGGTMPLPKVAIIAWSVLVNEPLWVYSAIREAFIQNDVEPPLWEVFITEIKRTGVRDFCRDHGIRENTGWKTSVMIYEEYLMAHRDEVDLRDGAREILAFCHRGCMKTAIIGGPSADEISCGLRRFNLAHLVNHVDGYTPHRAARRYTLAMRPKG